MDYLSPLARQLIVASSPQLAGLSVGGLTGYPAVLLNQLKGNDSSIVLDLDTSSWIASIHGLAGIPSILIPTIMQQKGRRFAFIASCLATLTGWILTYFATNAATILLGESFHGFGGNSLIAVSLITISEMVDPKYRNKSMLIFGVSQLLGCVLVTLAGYFLNWRAVSIVMSIPILVALSLTFMWPESPHWLACKGKFDKCENAFISLRGTGKDATKELTELIRAQKESLLLDIERSEENYLRNFWVRIRRRDFVIPILHVVIVMFTFYFSGLLVVFTYAVDIIAETTNESNFICFVFIDVVLVVSISVALTLINYFNNKTILIGSQLAATLFLLLSSGIMYCKTFDIFPKHALLVCVLGFIFSCVSGSSYLVFNLAAEVIPVKHRGLGGAIYIIISCLFHSVSLKLSPYLFASIEMSGTFLVFACVSLFGTALTWKLIPETKGRTLQEIEDYYNIGSFARSDSLSKVSSI